MRTATDLLAVALAASVVTFSAGEAKEFGVAGQTFPVIEPDLLTTIEARLKRLDASGAIAAKNAEFARRAERRIRRPVPVAGISPTLEPRSWEFDPSVTIENDVRDQKGNVIAARGQRVNPLDFVTVRQALVFIDGDDASQMDWATRRYADAGAKIILVSGSPIEAMTGRRRRFYFDQEGRLTGRFGIRHVPAVVTQAGKTMRVSEIALKRGGGG